MRIVNLVAIGLAAFLASLTLARHITGNPALAREAVQEAMLLVWRKAACSEVRNPRGWILRIVATTSLRATRRERRRLAEGMR